MAPMRAAPGGRAASAPPPAFPFPIPFPFPFPFPFPIPIPFTVSAAVAPCVTGRRGGPRSLLALRAAAVEIAPGVTGRGGPGGGIRAVRGACASLSFAESAGIRRASPGDWLSGRAPRSHRGGHWFDPSIAHPGQQASCDLLAKIFDLRAAAKCSS